MSWVKGGALLTQGCSREIRAGLDFYQTEETIFGETDEEREYSPMPPREEYSTLPRGEDLETGV